MMTNQKASKSECLVIGGLFAGSFALIVAASSAWHWVGGFGLWGAGEVLRKRRTLEYSEVFKGAIGYSQEAITEITEVCTPATDLIEKKRIQIVSSCLRQLPMGDRIAESYIASQGLETDWIKEFEVGSSAVCGQSKDGKTHLLLWRVQRFLEQHPDGILHICDPDYGSAHEGAEPNTWFGLPLDRVVHTSTEEILATIEWVSSEVDSRARTAQRIAAGELQASDRATSPILLVCDEWSNFWADLDKQQQERTLKHLNKITNRGIKQANVCFALGLHDTAVMTNGLPQALLQRLGMILLYNAAKVESNYRNLGLTVEPGEVLHKLNYLPKKIGSVRPCAVAKAGSLQLRAIPHLEVADIEVMDYEPPDPNLQWFESFWTVEVERAVTAKLAERKAKGREPIGWNDLVKCAAFPQKFRAEANLRYALFKAKCEAIASTLSETDNPQIEGNREPLDEASQSGNPQKK